MPTIRSIAFVPVDGEEAPVDADIDAGLRQYEQRTAEIAEHARRASGAEGWRPSEVVGHLVDAVRVNLGRLHARAAGAEPPGNWDQEGFVNSFGYATVPVQFLVEEFEERRRAYVACARTLLEQGLDRAYVIERLERTREHDEEHLAQLRG
jgi:hypothetical protein